MITIELNDPILEYLWKTQQDNADFTAKDVMEATEMPYTTVVHRILRYESQGVLINRGTREEAVGRPKNLWYVIADKFEEVIGKVID